MGYSPRARFVVLGAGAPMGRVWETQKAAERYAQRHGGRVVQEKTLRCPGAGVLAAWCREPGVPHPEHRRPPPLPPGRTEWSRHETHDPRLWVDVWSLDGDWLLARICGCGAQLPPRVDRDPDGRICGVSWEPVPHVGGDRLSRVLRVLDDVACLWCSRRGLHTHDRPVSG